MFSKYRLVVFAMVLSGVAGCSLVDPRLAGFQCDDAGHCLVTLSPDGGDAGSTGGGGGGGGGTGTGGGGGGMMRPDSGAVDAGPPPCSSTNCTGCCDSENRCQRGDTNLACGLSAAKCATCSASTGCTAGDCAPLKANGTSCGANAECSSGACVAGACCSSACSGACETCGSPGSPGICVLRDEGTPAATCAAYACDGLNPSCPTMCTSSRQCAPGRFCISGKCDMLKDKGAACAANGECQTGFCADSVCCDKACSNSCDRCDLAGRVGTCSVSPANDPGQPVCGFSVVCNGTLTDCPITCASGCPTNTYCSGTYCSAKKTDGTACGAAGECTSGFCANGVCCNQACSGACQACSTASGAATDGKCAFLGPSRTCRAAASSCDVAEHCDGTAASCPGDAFTDGGVTCGTTTVGTWTSCTYGSTCARGGSRTRPSTSYTCSVGSCGSNPGTETDLTACARNTTGNPCGTTMTGSWSACSYGSTCAGTGSRTRSVTSSACSATGSCDPSMSTETDTAGCDRTVEGAACGTAVPGAWSACSYANACTNSGSRFRTVTTPVCQAGACGSMTSTETDTAGCARDTTSTTCNTTNVGAYGSCSYGQTCSTSGTRTRTITTYACAAGACSPTPTTDTDSAGCARSTDGSSCNATSIGAWSACSYADACTNSGSRTRSVTTYTCGSGSCGSSVATETDTASCARNTAGATCSATVYGAYTVCSYASFCSSGGSRTRSVTSYACGSGACNPAGGTDTDTAGCARVTQNLECVAPTCGGWSPCDVDCQQTRTCSHSVCASDICTAASYQEYRGKPQGVCQSCIPR